MDYGYFMKKIGFALLAMLFILSCSQAQSQNDFYGKWFYQDGKMEFIITAKTFTSVKTPSREQNTFEIFSWEKITNDDKDTKNDYPKGYFVGLRHGLGNTTAKLFMHRDKDSMISIYDTYEKNTAYHQQLYIKQVNVKSDLQSAFYGTWEMIDKKADDRDIPKERRLKLNFTETLFTASRATKMYDLIIRSWEGIANIDNDTKKDYPTGFLVKADDNFSIICYLHRNKKSLLEIEYTFQSQIDGQELLLIPYNKKTFYTKIE